MSSLRFRNGLVTGGQVFAAVNAVQGEVDTLEGLVGTLPADAGVTNVVAYVEKKTAGIASDSALTELAGRVTTAEARSTPSRLTISRLLTALLLRVSAADRAKGIEVVLTRLAAVEGATI